MLSSVVSSHSRATFRSIVTALALVIAVSCSLVWARGARADSTSGLVALTNSARAAHGLAALTVSSDLAAAARAQAGRMAASHTLAHTSNLTGTICCWSAIGENVGEGGSVAVLQSAFMASPEHRANILSAAYSQVGIGVVADAQGTLWVSEIFRGPSGATPKAAPKPQPAVTHAPAPAPTKVKAPPATPRSTLATTRQPKPHATLTPAPQVSPASPAADRASRDLSAGRLPLGAAAQFAAQIASSAMAGSPDPVSRLLDFVAVTARTS